VYTRVLVPLDGSTVSMQVLPYAELVAKVTGSGMELLRALPDYPADVARKAGLEISVGEQPLVRWPSGSMFRTR
jgi:hypothetical protein